MLGVILNITDSSMSCSYSSAWASGLHGNIGNGNTEMQKKLPASYCTWSSC